MRSSALLVALLVACPKPPPDAVVTVVPTTVIAPVPPPGAPVHADEIPACEAVLRDLRASWSLMHTAAVAAAPARQFAEQWPVTPAACRAGTWHLLAAKWIRESKTPLATADGVTFTTARDALAAGLVAEPDHGALLAYVAFGASVSPDAFPPVPADACARLAPGDDKAYVCGSVAVREGRFADAANQIEAIVHLASYPDGPSLKRQAYLGAMRRPPVTEPTTAAEREVRCAKFGATPEECSRSIP